MNAIIFSCKRAFHGCLRITRPWLTDLGLTAARFDMLTAVRRYPYGVPQRALRKDLGVSAATISRMLRSLEELALITRRRLSDRRQLLVCLTTAGIRSLRRATRVLVDSGAVQLAVDCALTENRAHDESRCMVEMNIAHTILGRLRYAFRDIAELFYPYCPDD